MSSAKVAKYKKNIQEFDSLTHFPPQHGISNSLILFKIPQTRPSVDYAKDWLDKSIWVHLYLVWSNLAWFGLVLYILVLFGKRVLGFDHLDAVNNHFLFQKATFAW